MQIETFPIDGPLLLTPPKFSDARGFFSEVYNRKLFAELIGDIAFVQDNHSLSVQSGTIRGLHFQVPPAAQGKLVRVARGAVFGVAVDIRRNSATFGRHVSAVLCAQNWRQMWIPTGFAHGFCTIEPNTEVIYKVTTYYSRNDERGIAWNDSDLRIQWPVDPGEAILADRDREFPRLSEIQSYFD